MLDMDQIAHLAKIQLTKKNLLEDSGGNIVKIQEWALLDIAESLVHITSKLSEIAARTE